jgi:hypothetical protein
MPSSPHRTGSPEENDLLHRNLTAESNTAHRKGAFGIPEGGRQCAT